MPAARASCGLRNETGSPSMRMLPVDGGKTPDRILTRVDFPAPLSPMSPTASAGAMVRSVGWSARTGPKAFDTARSSRSGSLMRGSGSSAGSGIDAGDGRLVEELVLAVDLVRDRGPGQDVQRQAHGDVRVLLGEVGDAAEEVGLLGVAFLGRRH